MTKRRIGTRSRAPDRPFGAWMEQERRRFDRALRSQSEIWLRASGEAWHSRLPTAIRYALRIGGKRLRPILTLELARICQAPPRAALRAAVAIELVHTFSLIHDDLPAMDNDDLRRGKPTVHRVFGDALAILTGDWLLTKAHHLLSGLQSDGADADAAQACAAFLPGFTAMMISGQAADIEGERRKPSAQRLRYIHERKTAAMIQAACTLGALLGPAETEQRSQRLLVSLKFGRHLGLAFQIVDDLLDATGSSEKLGKRAGKDAAANKQTYPAVYGVAESRERARIEIASAKKALRIFGPEARRLHELADFVLTRER